MTDNGSAYKSRLFRETLADRGIRHKRTRPYTPRTNGKAERFIQTSLREWIYATTLRELGPANRRYAGMAVRLQQPHDPMPPSAANHPSHDLQGQRPWKRQLERPIGPTCQSISGSVSRRLAPSSRP